MSRLSGRILLALAITANLATGSVLAIGRVQDRALEDKTKVVTARLVKRAAKLQALQEVTNSHRQQIATAFGGLEDVINLARTPGGGGLPEAQTKFPEVSTAMDVARRANVRLPDATEDLIEEAKAGRTDAKRLLALVVADRDRAYLEAFDQALGLLIETHEAYSDMNEKIGSTFPEYERLFELVDTFLEEERSGTFRSRREAAQVFSDRTRDIAPALRAARDEIDRLEDAANIVGGRALQAFRRAAALRPT